jgi:CubicO group peptidase (beta-lactamase class C family)
LIDPARIQRQWDENFSERGELGASACVWSDEGESLLLTGGVVSRLADAPPWTPDTLVPVWSTTKGPAAATLVRALDRAGLTLESPVRRIWPELTAEVSFRQMLSHQAGLAAIDLEVSVFDYPGSVLAVERQEPNWPPGTAHGYHPRTFGVLLDECVRRLCGAPLGEVWRRDIAEPLDLDIWIGLPEAEWPRVATVYPDRSSPRPEEAGFVQAFADPSTLTRRAFQSLRGLHAVADMNTPAARQLASPAFGGIASARGLAKFYHTLVTGGAGRFSTRARAWMESTLANGHDRVLALPTAFSAGFQKDPVGSRARKLTQNFGRSFRAFGHPGAGGSLAFADPERRLGFAYVMNLVAPGVMPGERALSLVRALYSA